MLSTSEILTLTGSIAESCLCLGYLFLIVVIATSRLAVLKNPFYTIFAVTGVAAILNLSAIIILRLITSVFFLGPEFGSVCYCLSYISHACSFTHSVLKALQVANRFTSLFFPLRHDHVWASRALWIIMVASYVVPAGIFSFMIIDQTALYIDAGGGRMSYVGIKKADRELAKILITSIHALFIAVTLPMNIMLLMRMYSLRKENITLFHKEKTYLVYVLVITLAHVISGAHQIFWLIATKLENTPLIIIAQNIYAYPNTIITFTPPIVLVLMSKPVRDGIRAFLHPRARAAIVDSTVSIKITVVS